MEPLRVLVCGDFRALEPEKIIFSDALLNVVNDCDICICNFEAPVKSNGTAVHKSGPVICQSEDSPDFLKRKGFNAVLLANNHIMDYGEKGCLSTLDAFADVITIGAGSPEEAYRVKVIVEKGYKIGLLSLVQYEFGVVESDGSTSVIGAAWINDAIVQNVIARARQDVDYLFVFPHAGVENTDAPLPEWRSVYKRLIDYGADGVFASHPHVPQGWEYYKGKPIFYSLGNFYFDGMCDGPFWNKSLAVKIEIEDGLKCAQINIDSSNGYLKIDESDEIIKHNAYLQNLLVDNQLYEQYINQICLRLFDGYKYGILRGVCGVSFKMSFKYFVRLLAHLLLNHSDEAYLLNSYQCESHRWVIQRALRFKLNEK